MFVKLVVSFLGLCFFANSAISVEAASYNDWWETAILYQIYPRSFKDSDNDGIGDLQGIIDKIDHFRESGINAIWLSPIFESPQVDQGYDISNYTKVDPDYGTNEILEDLIKKARAKDVKVILDFVPNHTSDKHQWFIDSVKGVEEYRDYYVWANARTDEDGNRAPPNNWISIFKNSAWTWNEERQQYYLHQFAEAQPDLNYRNPKVVAAMKDVLTFWLDCGVDGFRVDAVPYLFENEDLLDEPLSNLTGYNSTDYEYLDHIYTKDLPDTFDMVYQWRALVDDYVEENGGHTRIIMTEAYTSLENTMLYYGSADGSKLGAHFSFNFNLITKLNRNSTAQDVVNAIQEWLDAIPENYTSNWVLGNHDQHRVATRLGPENVDGYNMLKTVLPGVSVTYNGEEIGQEDGEVSFEQGQDPSARDPAIFDKVSRDFERTPYQWDDSVNAGFNAGAQPWLPVSKKYVETNLKQQQESPGPSHYKVFKELALIKENSLLIFGDTTLVALTEYILMCRRDFRSLSLTFVFNLGDEEAEVNIAEDGKNLNELILKSVNSKKTLGPIDVDNLKLDPHEAVIVFSVEYNKTNLKV